MTFPNYITLIRIFLVPFFFTTLVSYEPGKEYYRWIAFGIFLTACLSDALDGILARYLKQRSDLGRFLDPLADKMLLISGYLGLLGSAFPLTPPLWIIVTIVFRDIVLVSGAFILFLVTNTLRSQPNWLGKVTTFFQMLTLVFVILQWKAAIPFWYTTAGLTILSCVIYLARDLKFLNGETRS